MTQEEKQLLLQDLSARLSYGTFIREYYDNGKIKHKKLMLDANAYAWFKNGVNVKPYLRLMCSMTEEELKEFAYTILQLPDLDAVRNWQTLSIDLKEITKVLDWLNAHHFDYRNLIGRGLAIEAPKNMYTT